MRLFRVKYIGTILYIAINLLAKQYKNYEAQFHEKKQ